MLKTLHFTKCNGSADMFKLTLHVFWVETLVSYSYTVVIVPGDRNNHGMEMAWSFSSNESLELGEVDGRDVSYLSITRDAIDKMCEEMYDGDDEYDESESVNECRLRDMLSEDDFSDDKWVCFDGDGAVE